LSEETLRRRLVLSAREAHDLVRWTGDRRVGGAGGSARPRILLAPSATSLGIVIPVLKDAGQVGTPFGQLVVAGASIVEIATIVLLSLFFSGEASRIGAKLVLLGLFVIAVGVAVLGAKQSIRISATLLRLQDTTAEIRIRGSFLLLTLFVVLAERLGLEAILGAFVAGRSSSALIATRR
jgi:Kef-type K+ transport system membrane component KefB